jgi:hypothetical protein
MVTHLKGNFARPGGHADPGYFRQCTRCVAHRILKSGGGTGNRPESSVVTAGLIDIGL